MRRMELLSSNPYSGVNEGDELYADFIKEVKHNI